MAVASDFLFSTLLQRFLQFFFYTYIWNSIFFVLLSWLGRIQTCRDWLFLRLDHIAYEQSQLICFGPDATRRLFRLLYRVLRADLKRRRWSFLSSLTHLEAVATQTRVHSVTDCVELNSKRGNCIRKSCSILFIFFTDMIIPIFPYSTGHMGIEFGKFPIHFFSYPQFDVLNKSWKFLIEKLYIWLTTEP